MWRSPNKCQYIDQNQIYILYLHTNLKLYKSPEHTAEVKKSACSHLKNVIYVHFFSP